MKLVYDNSIEEKPLPAWAIKKNITNWFFYSGKSMNPVFEDGDIIYAKSGGKIVPGDVIVFREMNNKKITVHRVVYITEEGFLTRGDNNTFFDREPVVPEQILGIAELFDTRGKIKVVPSGDKNLRKIRIKWKIHGLSKFLKFPFRLFYRAIKKTEIMHFVFGKWFEKKVTKIFIENTDGPLIKMTYKGKTIAVHWIARGLYTSQKPFDLLLDKPQNDLHK